MGEDIIRCRGTFKLTYLQTIDDPQFWEMVMSKMLITQCKHYWIYSQNYFTKGWFQYEAYSPLFEELQDNEKLARYEITKDEFNDIKVTRLNDKPI